MALTIEAVLLALGMGVRHATVRQLAVSDLTATVLTVTLTGLAAELPFAVAAGQAPRAEPPRSRRCSSGPWPGALPLGISLSVALAVACATTAVTFLSYRRRPSA